MFETDKIEWVTVFENSVELIGNAPKLMGDCKIELLADVLPFAEGIMEYWEETHFEGDACTEDLIGIGSYALDIVKQIGSAKINIKTLITDFTGIFKDGKLAFHDCKLHQHRLLMAAEDNTCLAPINNTWKEFASSKDLPNKGKGYGKTMLIKTYTTFKTCTDGLPIMEYLGKTVTKLFGGLVQRAELSEECMSDVEEIISKKNAILNSFVNFKSDKTAALKEIRGVVSAIPKLSNTCYGFTTLFY